MQIACGYEAQPNLLIGDVEIHFISLWPILKSKVGVYLKPNSDQNLSIAVMDGYTIGNILKDQDVAVHPVPLCGF